MDQPPDGETDIRPHDSGNALRPCKACRPTLNEEDCSTNGASFDPILGALGTIRRLLDDNASFSGDWNDLHRGVDERWTQSNMNPFFC